MNGYDQHSSIFNARRTSLTEAGDRRSDGQASQTRDRANRYDTSTPERRRKALAAARRSANPSDEAKVRKQINEEANSTIDALMLGLNMDGKPSRDNRVTRRGGYRTPLNGDDGPENTRRQGQRGRVAESVLNPQIRFRETVNNNGFEEAKDDKNLPPWLRGEDDEDMEEAELDAQRRNALPDEDFAGPDRTYPIDTSARARAALSRARANDPSLYDRIKRAVRRRYPDMDVE